MVRRKNEKITITALAGLLLFCTLACGCTSVYFCSSGGSFIRQAPENRPFEVIGPVHALTWQWVFFYYVPAGPTYHEAEVLLKQEAKKIGADAVIDIQFYTEADTDETSLAHMGITGVLPFLVNTRSYHMSGLAIKYTDGGKK